MPDTKTLHDAFLDELRDAYDAEKQRVKALPKLAKAEPSDAGGGAMRARRGHGRTGSPARH